VFNSALSQEYLLSSEDFCLYAQLEQPAIWSRRQHSHLEIVILLEPASAQITWDGEIGLEQAQIIGQNCICIIPRNQLHTINITRKTEAILIHVKPRLLHHSTQKLIGNQASKEIGRHTVEDPFIYNFGLTLRSIVQADNQLQNSHIRELIVTLAVYLLETYSINLEQVDLNLDEFSQFCLNKAIKYIKVNLTQKLQLHELAEATGISSSGLCRLFKESLGITPYQYILQQRIDRAQQLLKQKDLAIAEIAFECGFTHQSHLNKHFRRLTGTTPSAFRKMIQ